MMLSTYLRLAISKALILRIKLAQSDFGRYFSVMQRAAGSD